MIAIRFLIFSFILCTSAAWGQFTYQFDTLSIHERMMGNIDSVDVRSASLPTTFDGGLEIMSQKGFSIARLNNDFGGLRFNGAASYDVNQFAPKKQLKFSALPFLGFAYSFGGQGTQFIRAEYVQAFTDSLVLNIDYAGNIGNGYLRRSTFVSSRVNMDLEWKSKWYTLQVSGNYFSDSLQHNGGLLTDTLIETFGLIFSPVRKENAASANKYGRFDLTNYFHFNPGKEQRIGVLTDHVYDLRYRAYHETDTLSGIYNQINIDSTTTYDRYNLARIKNSAGAFYAHKNKYLDFRIGHTYWSNLNLGNDFDTTEIDIASNFRWNFGKIQLENQFKQNILGGFGAMSERVRLIYHRLKWSVSGNLSIDRIAPTPMQRRYFGNNYSYQLTNFSLEDRLQIGGEVIYKIKGDSVFVGASVNSLSIRNAYLFTDSSWWAGIGALNALQFGVYGQFQVGKFHFHPRVIYSVANQEYLPVFQAYTRIYFKSAIFKAKKLVLLAGIDASYISSFQPRTYIPSMDAYSWDSTTEKTSGMVNAHFFTSIEISTFRFFVRYENIGYFWNSKLLSEIKGYPIGSQRIRLGLTWSFFN